MFVIATAGIAVRASAATSSHGHHDGYTIHLRTLRGSTAVNSAGRGGPGNVIASFEPFITSDGQTGHATFSGTISPTREVLAHAAFVFPKGTIDFQVAIPDGATTWVAAVIGGTGIYEGVTGEAVNRAKAHGVVDRLIHLTRADD